MSGILYYLLTFAESIISVFGLRCAYEQPHYVVIQDLGQSVEVRIPCLRRQEIAVAVTR